MDNLLEKLSSINSHEDMLSGFQCGYVNLHYTMDVEGISIVVNERIELPMGYTREQHAEFMEQLSMVPCDIKQDSMWDCSGTIWLNDSWIVLSVIGNKAYFIKRQMPEIPEFLIND